VCKVDTKVYAGLGRMSLRLVGVAFHVTLHQGAYSRGYKYFERGRSSQVSGVYVSSVGCCVL
jgi:hypothetical protein